MLESCCVGESGKGCEPEEGAVERRSGRRKGAGSSGRREIEAEGGVRWTRRYGQGKRRSQPPEQLSTQLELQADTSKDRRAALCLCRM